MPRDPYLVELGQRLREARRESRFKHSLVRLACRHLGCSPTYLSAIERGERCASDEFYTKLCGFLPVGTTDPIWTLIEKRHDPEPVREP